MDLSMMMSSVSPGSHVESSNTSPLYQEGFTHALNLFHLMAEGVPAYKAFLKEHDIDHRLVKTRGDFAQIPWVDKTNYITKYPLNELCWGGDLSKNKYISMSSGSTGEPFFWPRGEQQDEIFAQIYKQLYEGIF